MKRKPLPEPENFSENRRRIDREVRDALKDGGLDIAPQKLVDQVTNVVVAELTELRERIAKRIIGPVIGRYECGGAGGVTDEQLEFLAVTVEYHFEDNDGNIQLIPEVIETLSK